MFFFVREGGGGGRVMNNDEYGHAELPKTCVETAIVHDEMDGVVSTHLGRRDALVKASTTITRGVVESMRTV
jgi:hypothetical protein